MTGSLDILGVSRKVRREKVNGKMRKTDRPRGLNRDKPSPFPSYEVGIDHTQVTTCVHQIILVTSASDCPEGLDVQDLKGHPRTQRFQPAVGHLHPHDDVCSPSLTASSWLSVEGGKMAKLKLHGLGSE